MEKGCAATNCTDSEGKGQTLNLKGFEREGPEFLGQGGISDLQMVEMLLCEATTGSTGERTALLWSLG